jgi:hypothetical protein
VIYRQPDQQFLARDWPFGAVLAVGGRADAGILVVQ